MRNLRMERDRYWLYMRPANWAVTYTLFTKTTIIYETMEAIANDHGANASDASNATSEIDTKILRPNNSEE